MNQETCKSLLDANVLQRWANGEDMCLNGLTMPSTATFAFDEPASSYTIAEPPKLRPYNADEMRALVGKVLASKDSVARWLVTAYDPTDSTVMVGGVWLSANGIKDKATHADGSPCGVLSTGSDD